ncbi:hypothetical protein Marme_1663 [Marinomonas mediterranea MMB-1]|uniref:Uncharacterized protein n=1 Tax=Marinomonas mediterranea (strain ATCC 700492 / JCM 21426 / NBRC 103028 / MMB-1) TaxID=717774 RepID=F2JZS0_MARM1|nr:hypothetical protein Marme_1663 [Marinomonas mediterranea MMB-1]
MGGLHCFNLKFDVARWCLVGSAKVGKLTIDAIVSCYVFSFLCHTQAPKHKVVLKNKETEPQ